MKRPNFVGFLFVEGEGLFCWGGIKVDARLYGENFEGCVWLHGEWVAVIARSTTGVDGKWLEFVVH